MTQVTLPYAQKQYDFPQSHEQFTDKYFLRSLDILKKENLNPWVDAQIMVRKGPGVVAGLDEALALMDHYGAFKTPGTKVWALKDGMTYEPKETLAIIRAPIQNIIALETMYLGVIAKAMTIKNDNHGVNPKECENRMRKIVNLANGKPVTYFGARHWDYREDAAIANAAMNAGAIGASTDVGAATHGKVGQGTIPHVLENIMAFYHGKQRAVVEATLAFDKHIDNTVPRIALIDYNNHEIDDTLTTARELKGRLAAVRIDTCGENYAQGAAKTIYDVEGAIPQFDMHRVKPEHRKFWFGNGVTVSGVYGIRTMLDVYDHKNVKMLLTSGFGDPQKVEAFIDAENLLGIKLFDGLGVGGIYNAREAKMDIVRVGDTPENMIPMSKAGRKYHPNKRLELLVTT